MTESLQDINDQFTTITIKEDEGGFYIAPHVYGHVDIANNQGVRVLQMHTVKDIQTAIETLQEVIEFKLKYDTP